MTVYLAGLIGVTLTSGSLILPVFSQLGFRNSTFGPSNRTPRYAMALGDLERAR